MRLTLVKAILSEQSSSVFCDITLHVALLSIWNFTKRFTSRSFTGNFLEKAVSRMTLIRWRNHAHNGLDLVNIAVALVFLELTFCGFFCGVYKQTAWFLMRLALWLFGKCKVPFSGVNDSEQSYNCSEVFILSLVNSNTVNATKQYAGSRSGIFNDFLTDLESCIVKSTFCPRQF